MAKRSTLSPPEPKQSAATEPSLPPSTNYPPPGWHLVRFDEMAESIGDRVEPGEADTAYYVGLEHLDADSLKLRRWGNPDDVEATKLRFRTGDIIFGKRRVYQRKLAVAEFDGICSAHAMVIRAKHNVVEPTFLPFLMQSDAFMERALAISVGSLSPTINWSVLSRQMFPLPPFADQRRIAGVLHEVDQALNAWFDVKASLRDLKMSLMNRDFCRGRIGDLGWSLTPLVEVADLQTGLALGRDFEGVETRAFPYLRVANVQDGYLDLGEIKSVFLPPHEASRYQLRSGDVLMTEGGDFDKLGRGTVWNGEVPGCLHQNHVFCVRPKPGKLIAEYLSYQTASQYGRSYFLRCAKKTSNLASINSTQVKQFPVLHCPIDEQRKIVARLAPVDVQLSRASDHFIKTREVKRQLAVHLLNGG